jgi:hypothetical protein
MHERKPESLLGLYTDSRMTIEELRGEWKINGNSTLLDEATDLVQAMEGVLTLRSIPRSENLTAHALAEQVLRRHGIEFSDRYIQPARERQER